MDAARLKLLLAEAPALPEVAGVTMSDILALPDETRSFLQWLLRKKGAGLEEIQARLAATENESLQLATTLLQLGYLETAADSSPLLYRVCMRQSSQNNNRRPRHDLWQALEDLDEK